jgi:hypothetical protein
VAGGDGYRFFPAVWFGREVCRRRFTSDSYVRPSLHHVCHHCFLWCVPSQHFYRRLVYPLEFTHRARAGHWHLSLVGSRECFQLHRAWSCGLDMGYLDLVKYDVQCAASNRAGASQMQWIRSRPLTQPCGPSPCGRIPFAFSHTLKCCVPCAGPLSWSVERMKLVERVLMIVLLGLICISATGCMYNGPQHSMYDELWHESDQNWQRIVNPPNPYY